MHHTKIHSIYILIQIKTKLRQNRDEIPSNLFTLRMNQMQLTLAVLHEPLVVQICS
jgi:hypothetical protein